MNGVEISLLIILIGIMYTFIPNLYCRNVSEEVVKHLIKGKKNIALTFDDGPDSQYTLRLLEVLKKYEAKATFFIVAEKAKNHPELIEAIKRDGHVIGGHSQFHRSAWLSTPRQTLQDYKTMKLILEDLKLDIEYCRPPWGTFNALTKHAITQYGYKIILWSICARDWSKNVSAEDIRQQLTSELEDGDIVLLHDSNGAEGAPARTIEALDIVIPEMQKRGYNFVTIKEGLDEVEAKHE